jgi:hypothetical protein
MDDRSRRTIFLGLVIALAACGPPKPYVRYMGNVAERPHVPPMSIEVYRANPPDDPIRNLGTINVTCPSEAQVQFGSVAQIGGCTYEHAVLLAAKKASESGADGIHSIETGMNSAGYVVNLRATAFYYPPTKPKAKAPPPPAKPPALAKPEEDDADVAERLRRLEKLKVENLITPEEYTAKRAEILKGL